jgi:hypothetical protein
MIFWLPVAVYHQYDAHLGNGQSALLQSVRNSVRKTYPATDVGADGQVVSVPFTDGIIFEVVPAFENTDNSFTYPDSNSGGGWKTANPRPEIAALNATDSQVNGNLKNLCRMARAWKSACNVTIGGLLIDTFAFYFIRDWAFKDKSYLYYDWLSRDFFDYLACQDAAATHWLSPGARQYVWRTGNFEYKATRCRNIALEAIEAERRGQIWTARTKWREIYGYGYPAP